MFTHLFLNVSPDLQVAALTHVRYNVQKRINALKYCNYKRISLELISDKDHEPARMGLWWDDGRIADLRCGVDAKALLAPDGSLDPAETYKAVLNALELLWLKRKWNVSDLKEVYQLIESDNFFVSVKHGKVLLSPDKRHKVEFICELYPDHADYYLCFSVKQNKWRKRIKFLQGHEDPEIFFWYFFNRYWRDNEHFVMSDRNEEIFFVFNIHREDFSIEYKLRESAIGEGENRIRSFEAGLTPGERRRLLGVDGTDI